MPTQPEQSDLHEWSVEEVRTAQGKGPAIFRSIEQSMSRITDLCKEKGIPDTDMRLREAVYVADSSYSAINKGELTEAQRVAWLRELQAKMLLRELCLKKEPEFTKGENEADAVARVGKNIADAEKKFEPVVRMLGISKQSAA